MGQWTNGDGLTVFFAEEQAKPTKPTLAQVRKDGDNNQAVIEFTYDNLPDDVIDSDNDGTNDAFGAVSAHIPAGSYITDAYLVVTTAFAGGTSYNIGLVTAAGADIDADGLDAAVATAALGANAVVNMDGALVGGTANIGAADGYVKMVATGTFTAGAGKIVINYLTPNAGV